MVINNASVMDYQTKPKVVEYRLYVNAFWVNIFKGQEKVYSREPSMTEWLDIKHTRITKAISELEEAILDVVRSAD